MERIPVYKPYITEREKDYVNQCLDSTWISSKGEFIEKFQFAFSKYIGVKYSAAVSNGTVALHLALLALGIGKDDEVIVPTLTYIASVNAITYTGAKPIFVDSLSDTWQMDPNDINRKITSKTKAILAVHLYGHPCDMDSLLTITKENSLYLIEDCSEAIGSKYKNKYVGSFGDIATFSFFGNKTITTGEGGMVVTNDLTLIEKVIHLKGQGLSKHREYWHDIVGYNYRMTNICAAIGLAQLEKISEIINRKRFVVDNYKKFLDDKFVIIHPEIGSVFHSYWMVSILVSDNNTRDKLRVLLNNSGVETRPFFYPVHTMPIYSHLYNSNPIAEDLSCRGINLPSYPELSIEQIEFISTIINKYFKSM